MSAEAIQPSREPLVATGIDAEGLKMPLPEKVRTLHPHLNLKRAPATATATPAPMAQPAAQANPVHATMDQLAAEMGADKSPAEAYILGGEDAPEVRAPATPSAARYPATESYRPLDQQPLAPRAADEKKGGWSIFGRKKAQADMRAEPAPEPRMAPPMPRATAQAMPQPQMTPTVSPDTPRGKDDDLFPDHKRDEQFEIPAFLRRQSN